jgi:DNA gyrase/topoisomerase IV subunit A
MIRRDDVKWWLLEARKHPEAATEIIEALAERLIALDAENERLRAEILRLEREGPGGGDFAQLTALRHRVARLQALLDSHGVGEPAVIFLSQHLGAARVDLSRVRLAAERDEPIFERHALVQLRALLLARAQDELLLMTSRGRALRLPPADVPPTEELGGLRLLEGRLQKGEWLAAGRAVGRSPRFWTVVTRRGYVRQFLRAAFDRDAAQGQPIVESPISRDVPVAIVDGDEGDLLVITRWGKLARFPQRAIDAQGSLALEAGADDEVVGALPVTAEGEIVVVTSAGLALRRETAQFEARSQPGGEGRAIIHAYDVLGAFAPDPEAVLLLATYSGRVALVDVADVPNYERLGKGVQVVDFSRDPAAGVALVPGSFAQVYLTG